MSDGLRSTLRGAPDTITVDGTTYARAYPVAPGRCNHCGGAHMTWTAARIVAAFHAWVTAYDHPPGYWSWQHATPEHPSAKTACNVFGSWRKALAAAGLRTRQVWTRADVVEAMVEWGRKHGGAPRAIDWQAASPTNPSSFTVKRRFGSWNAAVDAAGFFPRRPGQHVADNTGSRVHVDAAPVAEAVRGYLGPDGTAEVLADLMRVDVSPLNRLLAGKRERIEHGAADLILTAIGRPDVLALLEAA